MTRMMLLCLLLPVFSAFAAEDLASPPPLEKNAQVAEGEVVQPSDELLEPQVTIIRGEHAVFEEYRRSGQLYQVKVIPAWGPPYYLIDSDGDGRLETRRDELAPGLLIPHWILFTW